MSKIFVTGDTHGMLDIYHILPDSFNQADELTRDDYLIVAGDCGVLFYPEMADNQKVLKIVSELPYTLLWVDGNHENFDLIEQYPLEQWNGGLIQKISENCFHLMRGNYYTIDGTSIFAFGGGISIDRKWRREHVSWWPQELPNTQEYDLGLDNLKKHQNKVDCIITHAAPISVMKGIFGGTGFSFEEGKGEIPLDTYLEELKNTIDYKQWYLGHLHKDDEETFKNERITLLYQDIKQIK